jgi:hypothetical protein
MSASQDLEKAPYNYYEVRRALLHIAHVAVVKVAVPVTAVAAGIAHISPEARELMQHWIHLTMHPTELFIKASAEIAHKSVPKMPKKPSKHSAAGTAKDVVRHVKHGQKSLPVVKEPQIIIFYMPVPQKRTEAEVDNALAKLSTISQSLQYPLDSLAALSELQGRALVKQATDYPEPDNFEAKYKLLMQAREQYNQALHKP